MSLRMYQMKVLSLLLFVLAVVMPVRAQETKDDTLKTVQLGDVVVEAQLQSSTATVSTFFPTSRQKNASQSGIDLLNRMAIPQLALGTGSTISTVADKPVSLFIDFLPATADDLRNMRTGDVKKVEYYEYPSDPRFLGNAYVVNFVMKQYEYGGYVKMAGEGRLIANDGQLNLFGKFQTGRLTFDLGLGTSYSKSSHSFAESEETYRLPQEDDAVRTFVRKESVTDADRRKEIYWPTLKAVYNSEKVTVSNTIGATFDHTPKDYMSGNICYSPEISGSTDFDRDGSIYRNSLSYTGNWNFIIDKKNTFNFSTIYSYTHSRQLSIYREGLTEFPNYATDDSHSGRTRLQYNHAFSGKSTLNMFLQGLYYNSSTRYSGTSEMQDRLCTYRIGPGIGYSLSIAKYYFYVGVGFNYDHSKYKGIVEQSTQPWADASIQYSMNNKNRISLEFHHMTSVPLSSYRSEAIVQSNPLYSYTGNPSLEPYKSYDYGITYMFTPSNRFSLSAFIYAWTVKDRYAFVFNPTSTGILRTIEQPAGIFTSLTAGLSGRARLLQNRLQISGRLIFPFTHNGYPFNYDNTEVNYSLQAYWYFGEWNIGARYVSDWHSANNEVNGQWIRKKRNYFLSAGWGNSVWNISAQISNPFTWSWEETESKMYSNAFDRIQRVYGTESHCYVKLGVTYIFGFGKKVKRHDEASQQDNSSSAILE